MSKKYTTVIFDLDGTLLDTLDDLAEAVNFALKSHGLPLRTREEVRAFVGNGIGKLMERAIGSAEADFSAVLSSFKIYYKENCTKYTKPYEGIIPLLQILKDRGVKTAVVSNKVDFAVKLLVKGYFGELIAEAVGENEAEGLRRKPTPDTLLAVMKNLQANRAETVYIGDSEVDILTAKNAGVDCISVDWGFKDRAFLQENGAKIILSDPSEIEKYCQA